MREKSGVLRVLGASALICAQASCGDYDDAIPAAGAGGTASTGQAGSGGAPANVEASCDAVAPCGGDVVGTWAVADACLPVAGDADMSGFGLGCTAAPVTGALQVSGTLTANADGTFTDDTTTTGDSEIALPPECLDVSGTVTTCDRVDGALQALGFNSVACVNADGGGCSCTATADQAGGLALLSLDAAPSGTYATDANVATMSAGRTETDYEYCVSGNTMTMTPTTVSRTGAVTGTIVFVRQ